MQRLKADAPARRHALARRARRGCEVRGADALMLIQIFAGMSAFLMSAPSHAGCSPIDTFAWMVAYCRASMETDDLVTAQPCIDRELDRTEGWPPERAKAHYEKDLRERWPRSKHWHLTPFCSPPETTRSRAHIRARGRQTALALHGDSLRRCDRPRLPRGLGLHVRFFQPAGACPAHPEHFHASS